MHRSECRCHRRVVRFCRNCGEKMILTAKFVRALAKVAKSLLHDALTTDKLNAVHWYFQSATGSKIFHRKAK
jgi:hypothetical protein